MVILQQVKIASCGKTYPEEPLIVIAISGKCYVHEICIFLILECDRILITTHHEFLGMRLGQILYSVLTCVCPQ